MFKYPCFYISPLLQVTSAPNAVNWQKTLALVIILAIVVLFVLLAIYSNILRDEVNNCDSFNSKSRNPFSLSRVQLGMWTVIISCSYVYIQLCMGNCGSLEVNQTALILMGIGAGITTAGTLMDKKEIRDGGPRHQNSPSKGFFIDVLADDNGISIHRFQSVVWTGIAMIIYLDKVLSLTSGCLLPELSTTLLALTGISGTTYLVIKSQENNPDIKDAATPAAAPANVSPVPVIAEPVMPPPAPVV